jgi:CBS domain-containing protein
VDGKVDWMAYGLPVEGESGPFVGDHLLEVPTCKPDELAADVAARLAEAGQERAAVVAGAGEAVGLVTLEQLRGDDGRATVLARMEVVPDTLRPHVALSQVDGRVAGRLVTTPDGVLLGAVDPSRIGRMHDVEHDAMHLADDIAERFGDREPSKDELRAFLRERLLGLGRSADEVDRVLAEIEKAG